MDTVSDHAAVIATVEEYVTAMARGDAAGLARAMHPRCHSVGHFGGTLEWDDRDAFSAVCAANAIPPEASVPPHRVEAVMIAGDTAFVRDVNAFAGHRFRDSLTLLRTDGQWSIVAKIFCHLGPEK